jgi:DNA-directed RNA polymerase subunit RPC12/RpoP
MTKKLECQHDWETISDFQSYGYIRCQKCGISG